MTHTNERVAIVTGASRGIGRAVALKLAAEGFAVSVNYAGNTQRANDVVAEIEASGGRAMAIQGDVADPATVEHLFAATQEAFGRLDVVVNSAGVLKMGNITTENVEVLDSTLATNLRGNWLVMAKAAETLSEGGRIIAFSSSVLG
ncbi:SDR family NAD(P)-dependent oxidoreductase, partial [Halomonas sp. BBD48]|nr:SDR family NAD(P)-dependent oxidoreductase [Halomonas sp. BBD48]